MKDDPLRPTKDIEPIPSQNTKERDMRFDRYQYANEKLTMMIYQLATGEGKIKDRLCESFVEIAILSEDDFPQELRDNFREIINTLTKNPPRLTSVIVDGKLENVSSGRYGATIPHMRNKTAVAVAEKILELNSRLIEWLRAKTT